MDFSQVTFPMMPSGVEHWEVAVNGQLALIEEQPELGLLVAGVAQGIAQDGPWPGDLGYAPDPVEEAVHQRGASGLPLGLRRRGEREPLRRSQRLGFSVVSWSLRGWETGSLGGV